MAPLKINVTFHCPRMTRQGEKLTDLSSGSTSWKCCHLEKSRNTKKDRSRKRRRGKGTGARVNLMIFYNQHNPSGSLLLLLFISTWYIYTHSQIFTPATGCNRHKRRFLQGDAFGQFCPLSLLIFLEQHALSPPFQRDEKFFRVSAWQKVFCHLSNA